MLNVTRRGASSRAASIIQSEIRAMSLECERVGGINMSQGVCDTEVPAAVRAGAHDAIDAGINSYTRYDGLADLRRAIAKKLRAYNRIEADPDSEIIVSSGSTGALYCAAFALLDPGDEVIVFEPYYGYHVNTLHAVGARPLSVPLDPPDWTFTIDRLEHAVTPRTRAIIISTPSNPSGKVFTREELLALGTVAERHDLLLFSDEIYEYFVFDGRRHVSPASIPELAGRTITISGPSKTFSVTGWRIGYAVGPAEWAQLIGYYSDLIYVCAPAPLQMGVARGLVELSSDYYDGLRDEYVRKRDRICAALADAGLTPYVPQGAYYVLADASRVPGATSKARAMALLERTGVATVPGSAFYQGGGGDTLVRLCFAKPERDLDEACRRLRELPR